MLREHPTSDAVYILYLCLKGPRVSLEGTDFPIMSEAQEAAVLFIEQWRAHEQAITERDTPTDSQLIQSWNLPIPAHLCEALKYVQQESPHTDETCFVRNGRTLYSEHYQKHSASEGVDVLISFRERVYHWMRNMLDHLINTYGQTVAAQNCRMFRNKLH